MSTIECAHVCVCLIEKENTKEKQDVKAPIRP